MNTYESISLMILFAVFVISLISLMINLTEKIIKTKK